MPRSTGRAEADRAGRAARVAHGHGAVPWGRMSRSPSVWSLCMMYGFLGFSGNFYLTLLPNYLKHHRHLDSETAVAHVAAVRVRRGRVSAGRLALGRDHPALGKAWSRRLVGVAGLTLAGLAIVSVPWAEDVGPLGFLLTLAFFGNDLAMAPAWAAAGDIGGRYTGVLSGTMNMMASFMAAIEALDHWPALPGGQPRRAVRHPLGQLCLGTICWIGSTCGKRWPRPHECARSREPCGCLRTNSH